jgi:bifunctional non-homologous end joining protein LigD
MPSKPTAKHALADYKKKRDFTKTTEPKGKTVRAASSRRKLKFCIQKHLASHLHYDFRLEHNGVLLSWAVPKGPSLDPSVKRLAMKVEDHPLEYGKFEGVIPEGYGAGVVMLWDKGSWKPEVDDVGEALEKGNLKFSIDAVKLHGSWALIRTGGRGDQKDDRQWLLIKHRDEWSGELDVTEAAPLSVESFGDFADILAATKPKIWRSYKPQQGGETGRLLKDVIAKATQLKLKRELK